VCDYIRLNPVRAGVVTAERLDQFAPSRLSALLAGSAPTWLRPAVVLEAAGRANQTKPWLGYSGDLVAIAREDSKDDRMVRGAFSRDWAISTAEWREALAREHAHLALAPELSQSEVKELQAERWERALELALQESSRSSANWRRPRRARLGRERWRASFAVRSPLHAAGSPRNCAWSSRVPSAHTCTPRDQG
jgi:hypothetical protein